MSKLLGVEIQNLDKLLARIDNVKLVLKKEVDEELRAGAFEMNAEAVRNINRNNSIGFSGGLQRDQQVIKKGFGEYYVANLAPYAGFVEFGTGAKSKPPSEWSAYAAKFKGKGIPGGGKMLDRITLWVRAKGIAGRYSVKSRKRLGKRSKQDEEDRQVAYLIMLSILKNGASPHPFLYPAFIKVGPEIKRRIRSIIQKSLRS